MLTICSGIHVLVCSIVADSNDLLLLAAYCISVYYGINACMRKTYASFSMDRKPAEFRPGGGDRRATVSLAFVIICHYMKDTYDNHLL
jgi:hypothetical protein